MSTPQTVTLIASGDLRASANQKCEAGAGRHGGADHAPPSPARGRQGRARPPLRPGQKGHGFIDSQKYGMEVFRKIDADAPLVVAEAVWQYSHHVLPGLSAPTGDRS